MLKHIADKRELPAEKLSISTAHANISPSFIGPMESPAFVPGSRRIGLHCNFVALLTLTGIRIRRPLVPRTSFSVPLLADSIIDFHMTAYAMLSASSLRAEIRTKDFLRDLGVFSMLCSQLSNQSQYCFSCCRSRSLRWPCDGEPLEPLLLWLRSDYQPPKTVFRGTL